MGLLVSTRTAAASVVALLVAASFAAGGAATAESPPYRDCLVEVAGIDLQTVTIPELEKALDEGQVTSRRLVQSYLDRIEAFDGRLNSIRALNPDALALAKRLDRERRAGRVRGPLHGIPILLKDNIGTTDMPTTAGSIALEGSTPLRDAFITERLEDEGAIVLGKTNLSEFAGWVDPSMPPGYSSLAGQVHNAYTFGNPSGSSSGSGVAASMAFAAATVGTETLGSIVSPSNANSDVGIKPTLGLLSRAGILPLAPGFDTPGPMTRNVTDAAVMLGAMTGVDPDDEATEASEGHVPPGADYTPFLKKDALDGVRLGYYANNDLYFSDAELKEFDEAMEVLKKQGATLVKVHPLDVTLFAGAIEFGAIPNEFKTSLNAYLENEVPKSLRVHSLSEIIAYNKKHPDRLKYGQRYLEASDRTLGHPFSPEAVASREAARAVTRAEIDGALTAYNLDALVQPANLGALLAAPAGYPMVIVPMGYVNNGKSPIGLGFEASAWEEPKLISYAYAYEQAAQSRIPPTQVNDRLVAAGCGGAGADNAPTLRTTPSKLERVVPGLDLER